MGQAPELLRAVLTPLGERYGLDYNDDMFPEGKPKTSWEARAYRFLKTGAWLLVLYVEPEDFPATKRRARKRGAKLLANSFRTELGQRAVIFLTQAMGIYVAEAMRHAGEEESAGAHDRLIELVQSHYPLGDEDRGKLGLARDRLRRLELSLPAAPPLEDDADDELRERRWLGAQDAFRTTMDFEGTRIALGDDAIEALADNLREPGTDMSYDAVVRMRQDARWWLDTAEHWREAADAALS